MRGPALAVALLLAACAPGNRDRAVPMQSIAAFEPARLAGLWHQVARFPSAGNAGCDAMTVEYQPAAGGALSVRNICGAGATARRNEGIARPVGPGRLELTMAGEAAPRTLWVLWVDESYRTAVLGMPSGEAGWILNRQPEIPADRLRAAREVLAWNGYDLTKLGMVRQ